MHPRIYIGRLNNTIKKKDIVEIFGKYGEIVDILMKEDFAFVEFVKTESAQLAIKEMNGYQIPGTQARLVVEEARPKSPEERRPGFTSGYHFCEAVRGPRGDDREETRHRAALREIRRHHRDHDEGRLRLRGVCSHALRRQSTERAQRRPARRTEDSSRRSQTQRRRLR